MEILLDFESAADRSIIGGKAANLSRLFTCGFNVPEARIIPVGCFESHLETSGITGRSAAEGQLEDIETRRAILEHSIETRLASDLVDFVESVGGRASVRSSGTLEDAEDHAFAGQFATVLDVGPSGILDAVREVWASAFSANVRAYLERGGLDASRLRMAVIVQRQLRSEVSGVVVGDAGRAVIEAAFGQGEAVVSAEIESDFWDLQHGRIIASKIARKEWQATVPDGPPTGNLVRAQLPSSQRELPCLTDSQVVRVAELVEALSTTFGGRPQDGEFAFVGNQLFVLQSRDVTAALPVQAAPLAPWTAPGKGAWELDESHFTRPVTQLFADCFGDAMRKGFSRASARYGALISHADIAFVNRFAYSRMRPVAAPVDATTKAPPPAFVFWIMSRVVPELRRRIRSAEQLWTTQQWRLEAEEWEVAKSATIARQLELQGVDLVSLDDATLIEHLRTVHAHVEKMIEQHHTFNLCALVPTGDLLAHIARWTEPDAIPAVDILSLLVGASAVSADLRSPDARRLASAVAESDEARALLQLEPGENRDSMTTDTAAGRALQQLRRLSGEVGRAANDFLAHREYRLIEGLDPASPCFKEMPLVLWRVVRLAAQQSTDDLTTEGTDSAVLERCRGAIPAAHQQTFDALLLEARSTYHLRDERALYSDVWAWGILRSVCLEVGARLFRRSPRLVNHPEDAIQASFDELQNLLLRGLGPSATELQGRAAFQQAYSVDDAPAVLGPAPKPPPSNDGLPPGAARLMNAVMAAINLVLPGRGEAAREGAKEIAGRAASSGIFEGSAYVIDSPRDIEGLPPEAVLVVGASSSTFTMLAPMASAVIAEGGGLLSHVAIVCREYRIPCVCGCVGVLDLIENGDRVRVDGSRGRVTLLDSDSSAAAH